jgi:hypothetical protein
MRRVILLLAAALVLPACGGGDSVTAEPVAEAAAKTTEAGSSRIEFTMEMEGAGESFTMRGDGLFSYSPAKGRMTVDLGDVAELSGVELGDGRMEFLFDGLVYYMRFPEGAKELGPLGDKWLKIDLEKVGEKTGVDFSAFQQMNQNPAELLQFLRGTSDEIEELGEAEVRGVETTRYRATIDLEEAAERAADAGDLPDEMREAMKAGVERMKAQTGLETLPVEVWVDDDGLLRRMQMDLSFPVEAQEVAMEMTMDLFDFGVDVSVAPPPESQTVDITTLAGGGGN